MPSLKLLLLAVLPLASAAATARRATRVQFAPENLDSTYHWNVTGWTAGCTDSCSYSFNVSGPYSPGTMPIPAFAAACSGAGVGAPYSFCQLLDDGTAGRRRQVAARLMDPTEDDVAANATGAHLAVSFQFDDLNTDGTWWNYTSHSTQPYGQQAYFEIPITQVYGVA